MVEKKASNRRSSTITRIRLPKKEEITGFFTIKNISSIVIITISLYLFIYIQELLLHVFYRLSFISFLDLLFWEIFLISFFLFNMFVGYVSRTYRLFVLVAFVIAGVIGLVIMSYIVDLMQIKELLIVFLLLSIVGIIFALKFWKSSGRKLHKLQFKGVLVLIFLISTMTICVFSLTFPLRSIRITPKSSPELIFFLSPGEIPNDTQSLDLCGCNNISFMPSFGIYSINNSDYLNRIELALENEVNLYVNLIALPGEYSYIESVHTLKFVYKAFKNWLTAAGLFDNEHLKAFTIDAEQPHNISLELENRSLFDGINYLIEYFPTEEEIINATISLEMFIAQIHEDGKEAGIIRSRPNMDEQDGDGDIELLSHNIYSLDVEWDFSITMLYRSQRLHQAGDQSTTSFVENILLNIYGATRTDTAFVYSRFYFYLFVGMEQTPGDLKVDTENQYIFLGNYKAEFNETDYIKDKEFVYDLDVCRHFGEQKVFLYNYEGFMYSFGEDGINQIIQHNHQYQSWGLDYYSNQIQANLLLLFFLVLIDPLLYLDPTA